MFILKWELIYLYIFLFSTVLSLILTPIAGKVAIRLNIVDHPGERKIHKEPKPYLGGTAIFLAFMITIIGHLFVLKIMPHLPFYIPPDISIYLKNVSYTHKKILSLLLGGTLIYIIGTYDDIKGLRPSVKLLFQILAGLILFWGGIRIVAFINNIYLTAIVSILWVVLLTNSFNFLDNMDGLSAGVAVIISLVFAYLSFMDNQFFMTVFLLAYSGSILGFLRFNLSPSKIFMGDGGSMFIGFMMSALTMLATYYKTGAPTQFPILMPLIILGIPLFDTITVLWIRFKNKKPLMKGDTNHFSHRLVALGMSEGDAVYFIYFITLSMSFGALLLKHLKLAQCILVLVQTITIFIIIYFLENVKKNSKRDF